MPGNGYRVHSVVIVEDEGRNEGTSQSRTNFIYQLTQPINFYKRGKNYEYYVRIENVRIPISFYNINANYDRFDWDSNGAPATGFTITHGNYTIDELIAEVQIQMNADATDANVYTITYDEITQKVNIASDDAFGDFDTLTGDGWRALGFGDLTESITAAGSVDGNNVAYTNTARHLRLFVDNVSSNNVYANNTKFGEDKKTNLQKVSLVIPITEVRNEFQFYDNHDGYYIKLPNMSRIGDLYVKLTDANGNIVDLNDVPWGFEIVVYKLKKN